MTRGLGYLASAVLIMALATSVMGAETPAPPDFVPAQVVLDVVTLKDGTVIYGKVLGMVVDELHIMTSFGPTAAEDIVKIMWPNVTKLSVDRPIPFSLKEGTTVVGTAQSGEPGTMILKVTPTGTPMAIPLDSVLGMNQPAVIYTGAAQAGFAQSAGNSHLRNGSFLGELSARGESLRLTILSRTHIATTREPSSCETVAAPSTLTFFSRSGCIGPPPHISDKTPFKIWKLRSAFA